jgi:hypothetical protein
VKETSIKVAPVADPTKLVRSSEPFYTPLIIGAYGEAGCGKSRFLATCPDQIGIAPLEHKTRATVAAVAREQGKTAVWPAMNMVRAANALKIDALKPFCCETKNRDGEVMVHTPSMMAISRDIGAMDNPPKCCQIHYYRWLVTRNKMAVFAMAEDPLIKSIGIDTFGQFCDDMLYANYGRVDDLIPRERKSFNQEVRDFINGLSHKHLVLTHHSAQIWEDNKPTTKTKPAGFTKLGHYCNIVLEFKKKDKQGGADYSVKVKDCQTNQSLIGQTILTDEDITFQNVAMQIYPESDLESWV